MNPQPSPSRALKISKIKASLKMKLMRNNLNKKLQIKQITVVHLQKLDKNDLRMKDLLKKKNLLDLILV